ncbi:MAG: ABC transporter permease [Lachnospiraceae bacterium]|nr:ABC transporter permease [Lachnospiraceae bacterium]
MNSAAIIKGRTRALLTDVTSLTIMILAVLVSLLIAKESGIDSTGEGIGIALVNEDTGVLSAKLVEILESEEIFDFIPMSLEEGTDRLATSEVHGMIVIKQDFTEKIYGGDYDSLIQSTAMADSYDMNMLAELVINDTVKIWTQALAENELRKIDSIGEKDIASFQEDAEKIWLGGSLIDIEAIMLDTKQNDTKEESIFTGCRWYAALAMFYLMISGTWMCHYAGGGLIRRVKMKGCSLARLFALQSLPGLLLCALGFVPVLIFELPERAFPVMLSFLIYAVGASGIALTVCVLAGELSNLVFLAPLVTMAASLASGLLFRLPDWAKIWDYVSMILPGHWFNNAVRGEPYLAGAVFVAAFWLPAGILIANAFGRRKRE